MKITVSIVFLSCSLFGQAAFGYGVYETVEQIPLEKCNLPTILGVRYSANLDAKVELTKPRLDLLDQMKSVVANSTKSDMAVADQMSTEESIKFDQIQQKLITLNMRSLIESIHERDAEVLNQMVQVADKNYRFYQQVPKGHSEYIYQELLIYFRGYDEFISKQSPAYTEPSTKQCSMDIALFFLESEVIQKTAKYNVDLVKTTLQDLQARYKTLKIDREKLSKSDQITYDRVNADVIEPFQHDKEFIDDMEHIRNLSKASDIIYGSDKHDLEFSGGDIEKVGNTLEERIKKGEVDALTIFSIRMLRNKINDEIPSEASKEIRAMAKITEDTSKNHPLKSGSEQK